jgi:histidinol-phosphate aminotransferase
MTFDPRTIARSNIVALKPYSSAREEFSGSGETYLDANENPYDGADRFNRYPDPMQRDLKALLSKRDRVPCDSIFVANGSDEAIDMLIRVFCEPRRDEIIICPPTYGMYRVAANINDVAVREVPLTAGFDLDAGRVIDSVTASTKLIFFCSPNNPTGNLMNSEAVTKVARRTNALVVVDEAYAEFSKGPSLIAEVEAIPNIVVLRTLSKAYGLASARIGLAYADPKVVALINKAKPPYNVSGLAQRVAIEALRGKMIPKVIDAIREERRRLKMELTACSTVEYVYPSEANFLLVRFTDAAGMYSHLISRGVIVRDRSREPGCSGCLRITVGTPEENVRLLSAIRTYNAEAAV